MSLRRLGRRGFLSFADPRSFRSFNTLIYYAPTLFKSVGFENSLVIGLVISITK